MRDLAGTVALTVAAPLAVLTWWLAPWLLFVVACAVGTALLLWGLTRCRWLDDPDPEPWLSDDRRHWR